MSNSKLLTLQALLRHQGTLQNHRGPAIVAANANVKIKERLGPSKEQGCKDWCEPAIDVACWREVVEETAKENPTVVQTAH